MRPQITTQLKWVNHYFAQQLNQLLSSVVKAILVNVDTIVLKTTAKHLVTTLIFLKTYSQARYTQLIELVIEDMPTYTNRFRVIYVLSSFVQTHKLLVSLTANELSYLPSVLSVFTGAGWLEREAWDLYGLYFCGNLDLRRILTDYGFTAHPLRKDFPLTGFSEVYYSLEQKRIANCPVELTQEFRIFTL